MTLRWEAVPTLETETNSRKIIGHEDLWMLKAALDDRQTPDGNAVSAVDEEHLAA
jgi:hypothetical protein